MPMPKGPRPDITERLRQEAATAGLTLLGAGHHRGYRLYRLPCGHERELQPRNVQVRSFKCIECRDQRLAAEAAAVGAVIIGPGRNSERRVYRLSCGHEKELFTSVVQRKLAVRCKVCRPPGECWD